MRMTIHCIGAAALTAAAVFAQVAVQQDVTVMAGPGPGATTGVAVAVAQAQPGPQRTMIGFVSSVFGEKTVAGAPYSAEGVTEFSRTLADGTRIKRTNTSSICRDSLGRTRQEHTVQIMGALAASGEPSKTITITDPVAQTVYILNPAEKTATQLPYPTPGGANMTWTQSGTGTATATAAGPRFFEKQVHVRTSAVAGDTLVTHHGDFKTESLGKRDVEGVIAEGTRTTSEIPEGQIGNDRPITIVTETWHSPELKTVVLSQTTDPMSGDTIYRLTNINRTEPPPDLFQVPPDYTLKKGPEINMMAKPTAPKAK